jgi:hypothetical protein
MMPRGGKVTVEKIAVNAVMGGCLDRPFRGRLSIASGHPFSRVCRNTTLKWDAQRCDSRGLGGSDGRISNPSYTETI